MKILFALFAAVLLGTNCMAYQYEKDVPEADNMLVDSIYNKDLLEKDKEYTPIEAMVFSVVSYINEIGSREDFIQWFRWADSEEINTLQQSLEEIGAHKSLDICRQAILIAFPAGLPTNYETYEIRLYSIEFAETHEATREALYGLARKQLDESFEIKTRLAEWIRQNK